MPIDLPVQIERLNPRPMRTDEVFPSMSAFQTYLTGPIAYPGQVVAVDTDKNELDLYKINKDKTFTAIGGGNVDLAPLAEAIGGIEQIIG